MKRTFRFALGWVFFAIREYSRTEMNNVDFNQRIDKILGENGTLTAESASTNQPVRLLFFVHGGLNIYQTEFQRMLDLMNKETGSFPKTTYYPIFINWNSAPQDSWTTYSWFV